MSALPSTENRNGRLGWVDLARGVAIILVVYRHSLVGLNRSGLLVPAFLYNIQEYVYNFRMPVFFALSGIFLAKAVTKYPATTLFWKKVNTLLYPYILWTIIIISIQIVFSQYTNSERTPHDYLYIITQPRNLDHMWYLFALFNTSVLFIAMYQWLRSQIVIHYLIAFALHLLSYCVRDYSVFSDLFYHYIFLVVGYNLSATALNMQVSWHFFKKNVGWLILLTALFIFCQWSWEQLVPGSFALQPVLLGIILVACVFFYFFCRLLNLTKMFNWLITIGTNSLPIYILHLMVISVVRIASTSIFNIDNVYIIILFSLILGIIIPMIIYTLSKKWGFHFLFSLDDHPKKAHG